MTAADPRAPGNSGPGNSAPGNSSPGNSAPGNSAPGNSAPGNSGPGNSGPGNSGPAEPFEVWAPGKLVLMGEYAVLDGGPALVLAIDRGVRCTVQPGGEGVAIETPDGDDRFVRPALATAPPGTYRFQDWNPVELPGKPGFGGSAAACVAACIAAGRPASDALAIHRSVQGDGSGIDVAASIHGGALRFQGGQVEPVILPTPVVIYSGQPARTGPRVARYRAWSPAARAAFVAESAALVETFAADPVAAARAAYRLLCAMADQAHLAYRTPALDRIAALARAHGGGAKPSGAGGGDIAVAWLPEAEAELSFQQACRAEGLVPILIHAAPGARRG